MEKHMEPQDIIQTLGKIFCDVLDLDNVEISRETTAADIEEWDSLSHVLLMLAVEKQFGIKFSSREIGSLGCVDDLISVIADRANPT